jgi:hypothetical protein
MSINPFVLLRGKMQSNPVAQWLNQAVGMAKIAQDPQGSLNQAIANNPAISEVIDYINQNGGDPKTVFENLAYQLNKNPNEVLEQTKKHFKL